MTTMTIRTVFAVLALLMARAAVGVVKVDRYWFILFAHEGGIEARAPRAMDFKKPWLGIDDARWVINADHVKPTTEVCVERGGRRRCIDLPVLESILDHPRFPSR